MTVLLIKIQNSDLSNWYASKIMKNNLNIGYALGGGGWVGLWATANACSRESWSQVQILLGTCNYDGEIETKKQLYPALTYTL